MKSLVVAILVCLVQLAATSQTIPPIEAYGSKPLIRSMEISPDGQRILYLLEEEDRQTFVSHSISDSQKNLLMADATDIKAHSAYFATDSIAILSASRTTSLWGFKGRLEYGGAFSIDLKTGRIVQLLSRDENVYPGQSGIGRVIGIDGANSIAYMPAFAGPAYSRDPAYSLFKVNLNRYNGRVMARGVNATKDWIVGDDGRILAREDFDGGDKYYRIKTRKNGSWETVFEDNNTERPPFWIVGVKSDESALIINRQFEEDGGEALYTLSYDGVESEELFFEEGLEIDGVLTDRNRKVFGVRYSGMVPSYAFFDPEIDAAFEALFADFPFYNIRIRSWSDDWARVIISISGGQYKGNYFLFETETGALTEIGDPRPSIPEDALGVAQAIKYKARDGLEINAILTWPPERLGEQRLPLIVLPHGGPHAYDQLGFNWLSQFFANRGYLVLQPNFRGSTGFGADFMERGYGEWGGKMQDDVTDGVNALIASGMADPDRACIAGSSYGGYAALAGGAFTPELYKCVISIAGVADLHREGENEAEKFGKDSEVYRSWSRTMGNLMNNRSLMRDRSPVHSAESFQAPVLLIHGRDDTIVEMNQSNAMERALKKADKTVKYVKLRGGDHWLTDAETRLETLRAIDAFLREHNPTDNK